MTKPRNSQKLKASAKAELSERAAWLCSDISSNQTQRNPRGRVVALERAENRQKDSDLGPY